MTDKERVYLKDGKMGIWRTVGGNRIFIPLGKTLSEAMIESGKFPSYNPFKIGDAIKHDITDKWEEINDIERNGKDFVDDQLKKMGVKSQYFVTSAPDSKFCRIRGEKINLFRSDLAYIINSHGKQFPKTVIERLSDTIRNYDTLHVNGNGKKLDSYVFVKRYSDMNGGGLHVIVQRDPHTRNIGVVHINYRNKRKMDNYYGNFENCRDPLIDIRKR